MVHVVCVGEVLLFSPGQAKPLVSCASPEPHVSLSAHALPLRWDRPEWARVGIFFFPTNRSQHDKNCVFSCHTEGVCQLGLTVPFLPIT